MCCFSEIRLDLFGVGLGSGVLWLSSIISARVFNVLFGVLVILRLDRLTFGGVVVVRSLETFPVFEAVGVM